MTMLRRAFSLEMASVAGLTGSRPSLEDVSTVAAGHFSEVFGRRLQWGDFPA